jgi:hypothetical protein
MPATKEIYTNSERRLLCEIDHKLQAGGANNCCRACKIYAHIYNRGREIGRDAIEELQLKTQPELHHIPNCSYSGGKKLQTHYQGDKRRSTLDAIRYHITNFQSVKINTKMVIF